MQCRGKRLVKGLKGRRVREVCAANTKDLAGLLRARSKWPNNEAPQDGNHLPPLQSLPHRTSKYGVSKLPDMSYQRECCIATSGCNKRLIWSGTLLLGP